MPIKSDTPGFVKLKEKVPYLGKGVDELVMSLRKVLGEPSNKYVQKIVLEVGVPHIYLEKLVPEGEATDVPQVSLHDCIRTQTMEEYEPEEDKEPLRQLDEVFRMVEEMGLEVGYVVVGSRTKFAKWAKVVIPRNNMSMFGTPLVELKDIPDDVYLVCGTITKVADYDDIRYSAKGVIS
jgi:hypothetical protein